MKSYDFAVIGAGILGAATARELIKRWPAARIVVIEKEARAATHQTGRNSGVIHAGVYYAPGSLKARYCREGLKQTVALCQQHNLPYRQPGKLIVATDDTETERLEALQQRCTQNGLTPQWLDTDQLRTKEPAISGLAALYVKESGIVDYPALTRFMLDEVRAQGGEVVFSTAVSHIDEGSEQIALHTSQGKLVSRFLINCAGLHADRLIRQQGLPVDFRIIPFRGEYYRLPEHYSRLVSHLIYPVPDPALPFLGVHLTPMIDGSVTVGPNAVLALAREGYRKSQVNVSDLADTLTFAGFWPLIWRFKRSGWQELKNSLSKTGYLQQVRKYCPQVQLDELLPYPSGVRAQAVDDKGNMLHDFRFIESDRSVHVGNAPSPAATSALPIAQAVVDKVAGKFVP